MIGKPSTSNIKPLRLILTLIIVLVSGGIIMAFIGYRNFMTDSDTHLDLIKKGVDISVKKIHQTAIRNGVTEWQLDAKSVQVIDSLNQALIEDISVKFFLKGEGEIHLSAENGTLKNDSKNIEVKGSVIVEKQDYRLETETLCYEHDNRTLYSKTPVKIFGNVFDMTGDQIILNLNTNQTQLKGNVKGTFNDQLAF